MSTDTIDLPEGVKVKCNYKLTVSMSHTKTLKPNEDDEWDFSLTGGLFEISIYVPSPVDKWYSGSRAVPFLGETGIAGETQTTITVATGLKAVVRTTASSSISVTGPGISDKESLSWSADGSQFFTITAASTAKVNEEIKVTLSPLAHIWIGVEYDLPDFKGEIEMTDMGSYSVDPVSSSITIERAGIPGFPYESIILGLLLGAIALWIIQQRQ